MSRQDSPDWFPRPAVGLNIDPLVSAIASGRSVVFVGAGASLSAGLPTWNEFLQHCLNRAKRASDEGSSEWSLAEHFLRHGDFLTTAELLQRGLGTQLSRYIHDVFGKAQTPSEIHYAIARIPFSLAITTNYDNLLENAYTHRPSVWTWREVGAFFDAIKYNQFAVLKTHGDVGFPTSLVLTKTQYRNLMQLNEAFNSCFRMLLAHRTFLFVGSSLRDHDLLNLMDEARLMYGEGFGPHYAILFGNELDNQFRAFLKESYAIEVIECPMSQDPRASSASQVDSVVAVLREISGRVALERHASLNMVSYDDPLFNERAALNTLLSHAVELTGSFRGEICLVRDENLHAVYREVVYPHEPRGDAVAANRTHADADDPASNLLPKVGARMPHESVIGRLFLQRNLERDYAHIFDVNCADEQLRKQSFTGARYRICHSDAKSELACPVLVEGQRVGVVNVEANRPNAYTREHLNVLEKIAEQAGYLHLNTKHRSTSTQALKPYLSEFGEFTTFMDKCRLLKDWQLQYVLYQIDYRLGLLLARYDHERVRKLQARAANDMENPVGDFGYWFDQPSLPTTVFRKRRRVIIPDAEAELKKGNDSRLSRDGCEHFGIRGPVIAMPVAANGCACAVLVAWSDAQHAKFPSSLFALAERIHRMARLISNDPSSGAGGALQDTNGQKFLQYIDQKLGEHDEGRLWDSRAYTKPAFRQAVISVLLNALIQECCGLRRVRLWRATGPAKPERQNDKIDYTCVASLTRKDSTTPPKDRVNAYTRCVGRFKDPYVQYTHARFGNDPYACHQHKRMFGVPDRNCKKLDKAIDGAWIVGPIVRDRSGKPELLGYVSADTHFPGQPSSDSDVAPPQEAATDPAMQNFQRCAVDCVTDVLSEIMCLECDQPREEIPISANE